MQLVDFFTLARNTFAGVVAIRVCCVFFWGSYSALRVVLQACRRDGPLICRFAVAKL